MKLFYILDDSAGFYIVSVEIKSIVYPCNQSMLDNVEHLYNLMFIFFNNSDLKHVFLRHF